MSPEDANPRQDPEGHARFEELLAELSSRFINLPPGDVDREIEDALRRVCLRAGIDFGVVWQWPVAAHGVATATHVYYAQEGPQVSEPLHQEMFPWVAQEMLAGRIVAISSLPEGLPAEAAIDRQSARLLGLKSNLTLPLSVGGDPPVGALAFNTTRAERDWPDPLVKQLQLVAQVFTNAMARGRYELSLRESEARLNLAADSAEAGLWTLDHSTGVFWATERARTIFGYSRDEVINIKRFESSIHPDDLDLVREAIERSARAGDPVNVEYRIILPGDGGVRWVASRGRPHFRPTGEPDRVMGVTIDVTERKRGEEALHMSEARLAEGADLAGLAFYEVDFAKGTTYVDDRFRDLCSIPPEREQGLGPLEFWIEHLHPDDRERVMDLREQLHSGRLDRLSLEYRFLNPARGQIWIHHLSRITARDATERVVRTFGVVRDITDRKRHEEALRQSYAEIERLKDRLQAESDYLKAEIGVVLAQGEVTGQSTAIKKVLHLVEQVAPTDSSVLIRGETGTGKELIAQAIHRLSPRRRNVMVKVNCAALPSGLVESELFGREKGAFTGALARQVGRFEVADGSTIFLDEVGELPPDVQVKLLRVLQDGEFERLGSPRTIKVNVRVIAATNRDLLDEVRKGRFREDLFYRLNVFPIRVPPLRERAEDIPLLVWAFLEQFSSRMGKKITQVPRKTMDTLQRHPWPGNVRELRNVIEHGAIITTGDTLRVPLLGEGAPGVTLPQTLADAEREHILRVLGGTGWRIKGPKGAAIALGLNPATLYSRMKKLGIRPGRQDEDGRA
jgi:PAS domain S-box-containing protein